MTKADAKLAEIETAVGQKRIGDPTGGVLVALGSKFVLSALISTGVSLACGALGAALRGRKGAKPCR